MAQTLHFEKSYQNVLIPAEPGTSEFLQLLPVGHLLSGEFRKPRNYAFHKKFFKLLSLGYHYWTPSGGLVEDSERALIAGYIDFLSANLSQRDALHNAADMYLNTVGLVRSRDAVLLKHIKTCRDNDDGTGLLKTYVTVSVKTPQIGWFPYFNFRVVGY